MAPADLERRAGGDGASGSMIEDGSAVVAVLRGGRGRVTRRRADADERVFVERPRTRIRRRPRR